MSVQPGELNWKEREQLIDEKAVPAVAGAVSLGAEKVVPLCFGYFRFGVTSQPQNKEYAMSFEIGTFNVRGLKRSLELVKELTKGAS